MAYRTYPLYRKMIAQRAKVLKDVDKELLKEPEFWTDVTCKDIKYPILDSWLRAFTWTLEPENREFIKQIGGVEHFDNLLNMSKNEDPDIYKSNKNDNYFTLILILLTLLDTIMELDKHASDNWCVYFTEREESL